MDNDKFMLLKKEYIKTFQEKAGQLELLITKVKTCGSIESFYDEFYSFFHNLLGSGMIYGFSEVSKLAGLIEARSKSLRERKDYSDHDQLESLKNDMTSLLLLLNKFKSN